MLICVDLDDTLAPQRAAFSTWAAAFCRKHGRDEDHSWLVGRGRRGAVSSEELAAAVSERWELQQGQALATQIRDELLATIATEEAMPPPYHALAHLREAGHVIVIVTNGAEDWQVAKIRALRLDVAVESWVVSGAVGLRKPSRAIFEIAAARHGFPHADWMVGDNPATDIAGGRRAGTKTGWVSDGRRWPATSYAPTVVAASASEVLVAVGASL